MNSEELDLALEDLEVRLERLRALYEQYFLGFEKIEPQVARKEVDRRIYVMRREKIRNTGKRFKFQTLVQRYNTFQQYWQRICREIENGTYKRHVLRAERTMGADKQLTIATKRRFGRDSLPPPEPAAPAASATDTPLQSTPPAPTPSAKPPDRAPHTVFPNSPAPQPRPSKYESLDLDMGFLGSWAPAAEPLSKREAKPVQVPAPAPLPAPAPVPAAAQAPEPVAPRRLAPPPKPARAPAEPARPAAAASSGASSLTDDRVRELHQKLNQLKQQNREGQVSLESLTKTIRQTETQLRNQYKNRTIDFEIVNKDGKTIVKPKVR